MTRTLRRLAAAAPAVCPALGRASRRSMPQIDIVGGNAAALPIAVVPMPYQGQRRAETDIAEVIARRPRPLRPVPRACPTRDIVERPTRRQRGQLPDLAAAASRTSSSSAAWSTPAAAATRRVRTVRRRQAAAPARPGDDAPAPTAARDVAHQIADAIYEKILGVRGAFWTRIAYVTASGTGNSRRLRADGRRLRRLQPAGRGALAASRCCRRRGARTAAPGLRQLRARQLLDLHPEHRPAADANWSPASAASTARRASRPTARSLAMTLSKSGNPEIYVMDLGSKQLTPDHQPLRHRHRGRRGAPDGGTLYFTSDRGGKPQIYQVSAGGGGATRLTFAGQLQRARHACPPTARRSPPRRATATPTASRCSTRSLGGRALDAAVAGHPRRIAELRPQRQHAAVRREGRRPRRAVRRVRRWPRARSAWCWPMATSSEPAWGPYRQQR